MNKVFKRTLLIIALFCINSWLYANPVLNKKPKLYAIVIGIGEYPKAYFSSKFAKNDATAFYKILKAQVGGIYTQGSIRLLNQPSQTTRVSIQQAFENIKSKIKSEDIFIVFIAGEAGHVDDEYYLLTSQSQNFSAEQLKRTGLSATQLKSLITHISAENKIILLDTSLSDSVMKITDLFATHNIKACRSGIILTAGRYVIAEGFKGYSLFTYAVLDALSGIADTNKNGFIKSDELAQYVEEAIPMIAKHEFGRQQIPFIDECGRNLQLKKIPRE